MTFNRKKLIYLLKLWLSFFLFSAVICFIVKDWKNLALIDNFSILPAIILFFVHACNYYFLGKAYHLPLKNHDIHLEFWEWYGLTIATNLLNLFLPAKTGNALRFLFLHERKNLSFGDFAQMNMAVASLALFTLSGFGIFYFITLSKSLLLNKTILISILAMIFSVTSLYLFFPKSLSKFLKNSASGNCRFYFSNGKDLSKILGSLLLVKALYHLKLYLSFQILRYPISILDTYEISLVVLLISLVPILPGNIGIKEFSTAFMAQTFNIDLEVAMLVSVIERLSYFLFLFPVGGAFYLKLFGKDLILLKRFRQNGGISSNASQKSASEVNLVINTQEK